MRHKKLVSACLSGFLLFAGASVVFANQYDSCAVSGNKVDSGNTIIPGVDYFRYYPQTYERSAYRALTPIEISGEEKHAGERALKVGFLKEREEEDYIAFSMNSVQEEDLEPGYYVWSFWAKTEDMDPKTSTNYAWLTNERDQSSWEIFRKTPVETDESTGWNRYEMRFHITNPQNSAWGEYPYMKLAVEFNSRGTAYFDDMELYRIPEEGAAIHDPQAVQIEIENGDFEKMITGEHTEIREDAAPLWGSVRHYDASEFTPEEYKALTPVMADHQVVHSGNASLKLAFLKNRNIYGVLEDYIGAAAQSVKCLKKDQPYVLSFWVKNDGVENLNGAFVYLGGAYAAKNLKNDGTWEDASWELLKNTPYESWQGWDRYVFRYQPVSDFGGMWSEESALEFELHEKGTIYIDDVSLNEGMQLREDQNLLVNGDFEMEQVQDEPYISTRKIGAGWSVMTHFNSGVYREDYFNAAAGAQIIDNIAHSGGYALKTDFRHKGEANSFLGVCAPLKETLQPGTYKLSLWAMLDSDIPGSEMNVALPRMKNKNVSFDHGEKWELFANAPLQIHNGWGKYEFFFRLSEEDLQEETYPTGSKLQDFWIESKGRGVYYLDDVCLTYEDETENLIENGGFEPVYEDSNLKVTEFSGRIVSGSQGEFSVTVTNKSAYEIDMPIIAAAAYHEGQMVQLDCSAAEKIEPGKTKTVRLQTRFQGKLKGMLWMETAGMKPLCESLILE